MDKILQLYASTLGSGVSNSAAFADIPQKGTVRQVQFMPIIRGTLLSGGTDFSAWGEVSVLPTNRMYNNGDYGNVFARASWAIEGQMTTSGAGAAAISAQEVSGLQFKVEVGQRLFLHVYQSATPTTEDEWVVNIFIDV